MAVSFHQVMQKIQSITSTALEDQHKLNDRRNLAREWLKKHSFQFELSKRIVKLAVENDPLLKCALPISEPLDHSTPLPTLSKVPTLIAADGSQVNPDRHSQIMFSLVNIGLIAMRPGTGEVSKTYTFSDLKHGDELYLDSSLISEDMVSLQRDLAERQMLLEISSEFQGPILTLTDGPLEIWGLRSGFSDYYRRALQTHIDVLDRMAAKEVVLAGIVDKPGANPMVRLLEIMEAKQEDLKNIRHFSPLRGVDDRWLFQFLPPGARSAVFGLQSSARNYYKGLHALHFFYLNTSLDDHPWIIRVEIPAWVADKKDSLDMLHTSLIDQCRIMGHKPYPYILHRAHEVAVVSFQDKEYIEQLLAHEFMASGMELGEISSKKSAKDLAGRLSN
ncbi:MAG: DNA double-strand break repair nuclease NurA [Anaerolineales bacterium]